MLITLFTTIPNNDLLTKLSAKDLCKYHELMNLDVFEVFQSIAVTSFTGAQVVPPPPGGPPV